MTPACVCVCICICICIYKKWPLFCFRVQSSLASAVILLHCVPDKLNPVIRPLMEALKKEENMQIQVRLKQKWSLWFPFHLMFQFYSQPIVYLLHVNICLQKTVGGSLSQLLQLCQQRTPCPNNKVIKNLCAMLCCDAKFTPVIGQEGMTSVGM